MKVVKILQNKRKKPKLGMNTENNSKVSSFNNVGGTQIEAEEAEASDDESLTPR